MVTPLPASIQTALEPVCDDLRRMVQGYTYGQHLGVHAETAPQLVADMLAAGCRGQAEHMAAAAAHMKKAIALFPDTRRKMTAAEWRAFDSHIEQAFDRACWALLLEAFEDEQVAA